MGEAGGSHESKGGSRMTPMAQGHGPSCKRCQVYFIESIHVDSKAPIRFQFASAIGMAEQMFGGPLGDKCEQGAIGSGGQGLFYLEMGSMVRSICKPHLQMMGQEEGGSIPLLRVSRTVSLPGRTGRPAGGGFRGGYSADDSEGLQDWRQPVDPHQPSSSVDGWP